jgi:hypothetical protein
MDRDSARLSNLLLKNIYNIKLKTLKNKLYYRISKTGKTRLSALKLGRKS